jgi:hypothetical protein
MYDPGLPQVVSTPIIARFAARLEITTGANDVECIDFGHWNLQWPYHHGFGQYILSRYQKVVKVCAVAHALCNLKSIR